MLPRRVRSPLELKRMGKAPEFADLGHQANRRDRGDTTQCLQRTDHRFEAPASDRGLQRLRQPIDAIICRRYGLPVFGERRLGCTGAEVQRPQPAVVGTAP